MNQSLKPQTLLRKVLSVLILFTVLNASAQSVEGKLQSLLDSVYAAHPDAVGIAVHVESPGNKLSWTGSVGYADKVSKTPLGKDQPVLIASNTKTYVAATILKLAEAKKITLGQPIKGLITDKSAKLLEGSGYNLGAITITHLLSHTSGIASYTDESYFDFVNTNPKHRWTRDSQIALTASKTNPNVAPGEKYEYADINYLLLSEIIEKFTKKPFYTAIRELLNLKKHKLNSTWFVNLEKKPVNSLPLAHQYWNKYPWDSYDLDPSWDLYGGGGQASTVKDMALFFQLLFEGKIIKDKALLESMHTLVLPREQSTYCLGIKNLLFGGTTTAYYHGGFWGTDVMYVPEANTSIAVVTLQKDARDLNVQLSQKILKVLQKK